MTIVTMIRLHIVSKKTLIVETVRKLVEVVIMREIYLIPYAATNAKPGINKVLIDIE